MQLFSSKVSLTWSGSVRDCQSNAFSCIAPSSFAPKATHLFIRRQLNGKGDDACLEIDPFFQRGRACRRRLFHPNLGYFLVFSFVREIQSDMLASERSLFPARRAAPTYFYNEHKHITILFSHVAGWRASEKTQRAHRHRWPQRRPLPRLP